VLSRKISECRKGIGLTVHGDRLICARYRYDSKRKKSTTTVELVESENDWLQNKNKKPSNKIVQVRIAYGEIHLGRLVKAAGGKWNRNKKVWELPYGEVLDLGLEQRLTLRNCRHPTPEGGCQLDNLSHRKREVRNKNLAKDN